MLREEIKNAMKEAMKAKDSIALSTTRMILSAIKNKDVEVRVKDKEEADDADILSILQNMIKQRKDSAKMYLEGGREELAQKENDEISVIERFLPKQMSEEEIEAAVSEVVASTGASSMKDMGKVMGALRDKYAGQMDFGIASVKIKAQLS